MGVQDLQNFLESSHVPGGTVSVELLRVARSSTSKTNRNKKLRDPLLLGPSAFSLVVDAECCLHRLCGGYYTDWVSGGQWRQMWNFLSIFTNTIQTGHIDLVFVFNGSLESQRIDQWIAAQNKIRENVDNVLRHVQSKGTPPPKVWWVPPTGLRTALRMAFRELGITTVTSMDDHHQETIAYLRENSLHGLIANDAEYAVFDPPRYFSGSQLKLTFKGFVETTEYQLSELARSLGLPRERFCLLAALLGNYLLTEKDLFEFHCRLGINSNSPPDFLVKSVADFIQGLGTSDNLDAVASIVFGSSSDQRSAKLKQTVQYYMNGTKEGFLNYRPSSAHLPDNLKSKTLDKHAKVSQINGIQENGESCDDLDTSKFASETAESEIVSLAAYNEATTSLKRGSEIVERLSSAHENGVEVKEKDDERVLNGSGVINGDKMPVGMSVATSSKPFSREISPLPTPAPEVMRTASERHQKGLMSPYIYQILTHGEIKLPVLLEDANHQELPSIHLFYRPIRQMVYAILFNLHHYKYLANKSKKDKDCSEKTEVPQLIVKEWIWSNSNKYRSPDLVHAEDIGWPVPTVQRLWFGPTVEDKHRRLRAFVTCMRSDNPFILNTQFVPEHLLVLACVLRYIMSSHEKILRKHELDAIIAQAVSSELRDPEYLEHLQLPVVTSRGVQIATLLMAGVETALLVNDACGAPIPWLMCCPWLYFDGKLLQDTLARATNCKNLRELCGHRVEHALKVERMRQAILNGLDVQFARAPLPILSSAGLRFSNLVPPGMISGPSGPPQANRAGGRGGVLRRPMPPHGGQLEVAGLVVSSWGPPHPAGARPFRPGMPQIASPGMKNFGLMPKELMGVGSVQGQRPAFPTRGPARGKKNLVPKKKVVTPVACTKRILNNEKRMLGSGRGMTVGGVDTTVGTEISAQLINESSNSSEEGQFDDAPTKGENEKDCEDVKHQGQGDCPLAVN